MDTPGDTVRTDTQLLLGVHTTKTPSQHCSLDQVCNRILTCTCSGRTVGAHACWKATARALTCLSAAFPHTVWLQESILSTKAHAPEKWLLRQCPSFLGSSAYGAQAISLTPQCLEDEGPISSLLWSCTLVGPRAPQGHEGGHLTT